MQTIREEERQRYNRWAETWWNPEGPMKPLHRMNALRSGTLLAQVSAKLGTVQNISVLDVGCGAGLVTEAFARAGARVVGVDAAEKNVEAARIHAKHQELQIDYRAGEVSAVLQEGEQFDVVLVLEVVEHVDNLTEFLSYCASKVKPGGLLAVSTINRTVASWLIAIIGAEYVLKVLPKGTHQWSMFVRPSEVDEIAKESGMRPIHTTGMSYNPWSHSAKWKRSRSVNYMTVFEKT